MESQYGTARSTCTIIIHPVQSQSQKLTACNGTNAHKVQPMMQTMVPGVESPKKGTGSGHHLIPEMCQSEAGSKISSLVSHGCASRVNT